MYDAVITGNSNERDRSGDGSGSNSSNDRNGSDPQRARSKNRSSSMDDRPTFSSLQHHTGKKYQLYIGNLTWVNFFFLNLFLESYI